MKVYVVSDKYGNNVHKNKWDACEEVRYQMGNTPLLQLNMDNKQWHPMLTQLKKFLESTEENLSLLEQDTGYILFITCHNV